MKVWLVVAEDYGKAGSSVVHVCATKEIAESFCKYEHIIDYTGPVYKIKQMTVESEIAEIPEDLI
jgi:hypothetical protein